MIDWLVLNGGASTRLGTDKSATVLAGRTLTDHAVRIIRAIDPSGSIRIVGRDRTGGPAAAVVSMLPEIASPFLGVFAVDMPFADAALDAVVSRARRDALEQPIEAPIEAWVPVATDGRAQWLCAVYRTSSLRASAGERDDWRDAPFHALIGGLTTMSVLVANATSLLDIDTPEDLRKAQAIAVMDEQQATRVGAWLERVSSELGFPAPTDIEAILDVAKDAAHSIERPAAPVTTFMLGYAVAQGADVRVVADTIARMARDFDG